jgi:hypothetical protein
MIYFQLELEVYLSHNPSATESALPARTPWRQRNEAAVPAIGSTATLPPLVVVHNE